MHIETIKLSNFWCFGPEPTIITLDPTLSALIGGNGSGKTAAMRALSRMFASTEQHRKVRRTDFHVPSSANAVLSGQSLFIEAIFIFPELGDPNDNAGVSDAVPHFFRHMTIEDSGVMKCRIRLEATWTDDGTADGDVEQRLFVLNTLDEQFDEETNVHPLKAQDRAAIRMIYVPALRSSNPFEVLKASFWRAISWSDVIRDKYVESASELQSSFDAESSVSKINDRLNTRWHDVHTAATETDVSLSPIEREFDAFVGRVDAIFSPAPDGRTRSLDELSDGQRSLFYIAMAASMLDVEKELQEGTSDGFDLSEVKFPALTLLAIEEPENNVSPFFISRILNLLNDCASGNNVQSLISTHSSSTLVRIDPDRIRYFRRDSTTGASTVKTLTLPDSDAEAGKYIREAVKAYPELYFARSVILGEGDSEQIVLPKLAETLGLPIDRSFVAMVPLGGRHVNHLWRLLSDLEIPHVTLLDLDLGRSGGGWGRIKYVCEQLHQINRIDEANYQTSLTLPPDGGDLYNGSLRTWIEHLRTLGVFFSDPLDLDFSMLEAFEAEYCQLEGRDRGPQGEPEDAKRAVLKGEGDPDVYDEAWDELFLWYRYLFLGRGKPTSHLAGLARCSTDELASRIPEELAALLKAVSDQIESVRHNAE